MVDDIAIQRQFSERLIAFRKEKKFSRQKLAELASLSESSITQYEQGIKAPSIINIRRLAEALDVTVNDLCGTDFEEKWKESPVRALLTALELFQFQIIKVGTDTITLGIKEDCSDYSAYEVKRFFEKYKAIRASENLAIGESLRYELIASLAQEFRHLPDLPPYVMPDT